jgi:quercetin dioxygenase-like cupin family protein
MSMKRRTIAGVAGGVILGLCTAGVALATAGDGASGTILVRGFAEEKVRMRGNNLPYDVVVQEIVILPGGHTGWHTHPGIAVAVVKAGALTVYDADDESCTGTEYVAGQVYVDPGYGHVHIARNEGSTPTEVVVTYLDVPFGGGSIRIDAPDPGTCTW